MTEKPNGIINLLPQDCYCFKSHHQASELIRPTIKKRFSTESDGKMYINEGSLH